MENELGARLRRIREKNNMTQHEVASLLNITRSAYTYYETGRTQPSIRNIVTLAKIYKITTDEILLPKKRKTYLGK